MGSKEVWNLEFRQGWAFIGYMGERSAQLNTMGLKEPNEKRAQAKEQSVDIT